MDSAVERRVELLLEVALAARRGSVVVGVAAGTDVVWVRRCERAECGEWVSVDPEDSRVHILEWKLGGGERRIRERVVGRPRRLGEVCGCVGGVIVVGGRVGRDDGAGGGLWAVEVHGGIFGRHVARAARVGIGRRLHHCRRKGFSRRWCRFRDT